jgi:hypothetical protein
MAAWQGLQAWLPTYWFCLGGSVVAEVEGSLAFCWAKTGTHHSTNISMAARLVALDESSFRLQYEEAVPCAGTPTRVSLVPEACDCAEIFDMR